MHLRWQGRPALWRAWLAAAATQLDGLAHWSADELEQLNGSHALEVARATVSSETAAHSNRAPAVAENLNDDPRAVGI